MNNTMIPAARTLLRTHPALAGFAATGIGAAVLLATLAAVIADRLATDADLLATTVWAVVVGLCWWYLQALLATSCAAATLFETSKVLRAPRAAVNAGSAAVAVYKALPQLAAWTATAPLVAAAFLWPEPSRLRTRLSPNLRESTWYSATFMTVPVIVMEGGRPLAAFERAAGWLRFRWGTGITVADITRWFWVAPTVLALPLIWLSHHFDISGSRGYAILALSLITTVGVTTACVRGVAQAIVFRSTVDGAAPRVVQKAEHTNIIRPRPGSRRTSGWRRSGSIRPDSEVIYFQAQPGRTRPRRAR